MKKLHGIRLEWEMAGSRPVKMKEIAGSEFELDCDLCLLGLGFVHPEHPGPIEQLGLAKDNRGNVQVERQLHDQRPRRLRRRRHAPRPKPGRLGHQRRPLRPMRSMSF